MVSLTEWEKISGNLLAEKLLTRTSTCSTCMIACGRKVKRVAGQDLAHAEGPEFETLCALGTPGARVFSRFGKL